MLFFPGVLLDVLFEVGGIITQIVALIAFVRFLLSVLLDMTFQVGRSVA